MDLLAPLERHFGYPGFRPGQETLVRAAVEGRDAMGILPTGGGKSVCYMLPAAVLDGLTVVVSPLISLMDDQVARARQAGIPAALLNSTQEAGSREAVLERAARGELRLLLVAPERFRVASFRRRLAGIRVALMAVDEAHCISQWGHDFRPAYRELGAVRAALGAPCMALTATATPRVREEIVEVLGLRDPVRVVGSFDRPNLSWEVRSVRDDGDRESATRTLLRSVLRPGGARRRRREAPGGGTAAASPPQHGSSGSSGSSPSSPSSGSPGSPSSPSSPSSGSPGSPASPGSAVVYTATRKRVEILRARWAGLGLPVEGYHGGMRAEERSRVQEAFMAGERPVVVATNAFGMGVDKPDVRLVVHWELPGSLEAYYQEAGRAGRDGEPARCVAFYRPGDLALPRAFLDRSRPPVAELRRVLRALVRELGPGGDGTVDAERLAGELNRRRGWRLPGGSRGSGGSRGWTPERLSAALASLETARALRCRDAAGLRPGEPAGDGSWRFSLSLRPGRPGLDGARRLRVAGEARIRAVVRYARDARCRRRSLLAYFGEVDGPEGCGRCDLCRASPTARRRRRLALLGASLRLYIQG